MNAPETVTIDVQVNNELAERFDRIDAANKRIIELRRSMLRWTIAEVVVLGALLGALLGTLLVVAAVGL